MLLPFSNSLIRTHKFDCEMAIFADGHYSRQTVGSNQFMPPGETMVLRNYEGTVLFGWLYQQFRADGEVGICCTIFRNESPRQSSEIVREAETHALRHWYHNRVFTYIDPDEVKSPNPGYCFKMAGWKFVRLSKTGLHLLAKGENEFRQQNGRI